MPAGLHPADSLNHFMPDLGIPRDSFRSGSALKTNNLEVRIFANSICLGSDAVPISGLVSASIVERNVDGAEIIDIISENSVYRLNITSNDRKYKDVLEVDRFFLRIIEDGKLEIRRNTGQR